MVRVLKKMSGTENDKGTDAWRKLRNVVSCWLDIVQWLNKSGQRRLHERCDKNNAMLEENPALLRYYESTFIIIITDVSVQNIVPILKDQEYKQKCLTLENGTCILFRNIGTKLSLLTA